MTLPRKDQAKADYLATPQGRFLAQLMARHDVPISQISDTMLPDNFEFDGVKVVYGQTCKTAGEYKTALAKNDKDMGGWHG